LELTHVTTVEVVSKQAEKET